DSIIPLNFTTTKGREEFSAATKTMLVDDKGTIWLGTNNQGLYKIDDNENGRYQIEHFPITSKRILSLLSTPRNTLLCGTENDGMFEMDHEGNIINHYLKDKFDDKGIKSNSIWSLFLDNRERIWMGYYNNGVAIYDRFYDKFPDLVSKPYNTNSLQSSSVTDILQDDKGRFWIGMDGGGIDIYEPVLNTFTHLLDSKNEIANGLDAPNVQTIFKDSKKNIWVGTWDNGIYLLKNGTQQFIHYTVESTNSSLTSDRIINFSEDATGTIWIATFSGGLQSFDPRYNNFTNYRNEPFLSQNLSYSDIRKIYVDSEDNLWIASNAGLFRLLLTGNSFGLENLTGRLYNSRENTGYKSLIIDIYEDSEKNIWLGTASAGLFKYSMVSDEFETINTENGFNKVTVSSLIEDESGDLWAAGNNGITRIDQEKNIIKNFSESDGLLANDFNSHAAYKDKEGKLWFGSYNGVNFFDPEDLASNKTTPSVYLTDLKIFNKTVEPNNERSPLNKVISQTSSLSLSHEKSVFTIDYAAIDFTRPEKIQFAYYLDGFEEDYNYVQNTRSATYTNLPSGSYTFKVKASNSDGLWSETPTILNIEILRPWWLTNIAIIVYFFVLALVSYVIYWYLLKRIKARRAIENEREKHNQEEALNTKKIQFFTNISHEFRTPLTLILSPLEDILSETGLSEKIKEKHRIIYKNTDRLKRLIDELMDFRKLQLNKLPLYVTSFDINDLASDVLDHFKEEAQQRNIVIAFEGADLREPIWADKNKLEKVIFNILSNAFKSTGNNGIITLKLNEKDHKFKAGDRISDAIEISIEDTGKGIPSEELNKIFDRFYQIKDRNEQYFNGTGIGLELVKSFVELHHGEIQVQSEIDVGTLFKIIIPIQNDDHSETKGNESSGHNELSNDNKNIGQREVERTINEGKRTVLIVEDNIELKDYIARELKDVYHIYTSENGIDGFKQAQKYIPDVIITD
ncbi:MAG: two-component regulator propeller domain-containing protein, partial [Leeuwenhoekiella sp.]